MIDPKTLTPGDILILLDKRRMWDRVLEYVGPDEGPSTAGGGVVRVLVDDPENGHRYTVRLDYACRAFETPSKVRESDGRT